MKIAVISAAGRSGRMITDEAVSRGHEVTAVVRECEKEQSFNPAVSLLVRDILDITSADLFGFDVVIDCFGVWQEKDAHLHTDSLMHLCDCLSGTDVRLLVVGGAGSLFTDASHRMHFHEDPNFPADTRVMSAAQAESFEHLKKRNDVRWTYLCPNGLYLPEGPRTGNYVLAGDEIIPAESGPMPIRAVSYANLAVAMVDEAEQAKAVGRRISVYNG